MRGLTVAPGLKDIFAHLVEQVALRLVAEPVEGESLQVMHYLTQPEAFKDGVYLNPIKLVPVFFHIERHIREESDSDAALMKMPEEVSHEEDVVVARVEAVFEAAALSELPRRRKICVKPRLTLLVEHGFMHLDRDKRVAVKNIVVPLMPLEAVARP